MARQSTKKPTSGRRPKSVVIEEKNIGRETTDWSKVKDMTRALHDTFRHYDYFYDTKVRVKWAKDWVKKNRTKTDYKYFVAAPDWAISPTLTSLCRMHDNGAPFDADRLKWMNTKVDETIAKGREVLSEKKKEPTTATKRSPAEIVKERTSEFIGGVEVVLDNWTENDEYSLYDEMKKEDVPYVTAKNLVDYYTPVFAEIEELVTKKTADLVEAYSNLGGIRNQKKYLAFIKKLIDDAILYMNSKKAVRAPRKKKVQTTSQQIAKVTYQKESTEYKLTSLDPSNIVGATMVILFNTKTRYFTYLNTSASNGFTVKGTTIQGVDLETSTKKKIRKPEDFLAAIAKTTKAKLVKEYEALKTKAQPGNGRLNEDTIILKAFK